MKYQLVKIIIGNKIIENVKLFDDNGGSLSIPFAPDNTDYQAYLKWLEEGNTPLPAEENN